MACTRIWIYLTCLATLLIFLLGAAPVTNAQTVTDLYNFNQPAGDPASFGSPGTMAQGLDGNIYSTSPNGGFMSGNGTVFDITPLGALSNPLLYTFYNPPSGISNGCAPESGTTLGTDGNLYGTVSGCGTLGFGAVFKIAPGGGDLIPLYNFSGGSDGGYPFAAPVEGTDGNFYGVTTCGGIRACPGGPGTLYKITPAGKLTTIYRFDEVHAAANYAPLILAADGNFYGTGWGAADGGNAGVVYRITPAGEFTVLYSFCSQPQCVDGFFPYAALVQGSDGTFYGTAAQGGQYGFGVIFKFTPAGGFTVLHSFNGNPDGGQDLAGLAQATDGNFYGVTYAGVGSGTIFNISPVSPYNYSVLYTFDGTAGGLPSVTPIQHTNGTLYGLSFNGGTYGSGTFYSIDMGLNPFVTLPFPTGKVGTTVQILGQSLTGAMGVSFNGTPSIFTVVSDTYITATVPAGATTGSVTVTTPTSTLTSNVPFRVLPNSQSATTTKLTTSGSPSLLSQPVTFTATITSSGGSVPDGEAVPFFDGATQIGLGSTASGVATFTTSTLSGKTHTIKAIYAGDTAFKTSTGMVTQIVELAPTTTSLNSSANPSNFGQSVTLTAVVSNSGGPTPTGTVTFKNGSTTIGTAKLDSTATATFITTKLPLGSASLTASYGGDTQNAKSTSTVLMQTINQAQISLSLASSPNPSTSGKPVKFTATLTSNGGLPNGQIVTFTYNGGMTLGTATISGGKAIFTTSALPSGSDQVTATYAGTADYSSASNTVTQTVN